MGQDKPFSRKALYGVKGQVSKLTLGTGRGSLLCEDLREGSDSWMYTDYKVRGTHLYPSSSHCHVLHEVGVMGGLETGQEFHSSRGLVSPVHSPVWWRLLFTALCDGVSCPQPCVMWHLLPCLQWLTGGQLYLQDLPIIGIILSSWLGFQCESSTASYWTTVISPLSLCLRDGGKSFLKENVCSSVCGRCTPRHETPREAETERSHSRGRAVREMTQQKEQKCWNLHQELSSKCHKYAYGNFNREWNSQKQTHICRLEKTTTTKTLKLFNG